MSPETTNEKLIGWIASVSGVIGAILLALNIDISRYGYVFFLVSSVLLVVWSLRRKATHTLAMNFVFVFVNFLGLYQWVIAGWL